ncbi:MAG: cytochrome c [Gammaproteobacteria bacterium]|nr:cytochrome c [Gammaproteobacteria bacterium]
MNLYSTMTKTQNLVLVAGLVLVASLSTYSYLAKQDQSSKWYSTAQVIQGSSLFADHCAACHGTEAQGAINWMQPNAAGVRGAPPLNGSGHSWHHSLADLTHTVINGRGNMPSWKGTLTQHEIISILAWTQSQWPAATYKAWSEAHR